MIGLIKQSLYNSTRTEFLWLEELREVILDVEVTLEDDIKFPILTPNSLLSERSNILPKVERDRCNETAWREWRNEYLRGLRERNNQQHSGKSNSPMVSEFVVIKSDEKNRGKWKIGVVEKVIRGIDAVVRGARVRAGTSVHRESGSTSFH